MPDYRPLFKSCGQDVAIADNVHIEHPELLEVGDRVRFMPGFHMGLGRPARVRIGNDVTFYPNCFIQGAAARFTIAHNVDFFPNTYISLGDQGSYIDIGPHTHFAPNCVLYGWGGLTIGPYCNVAAHTVFATVGHDPLIREKPMALAPAKKGPITLEEDVWIAANCTIGANVTLARGCILAANSFLRTSTTPYGLYAGSPARRIRDRARA